MSYIHQLMPEYTLTHVVVYTYSSCDINAVMPWYTLTCLTLFQLLLFHVTVYFIWLQYLICIFALRCCLLIRIILLIHFTCAFRLTICHHLFLEFWLINTWFFAHWRHQLAVTRLENVRQLNITRVKAGFPIVI